jgi:hypothetical protein
MVLTLNSFLIELFQKFERIFCLKKIIKARYWWLTPVILATQDAEIRKTAVPSQPGQNSFRDPILKILNTKKGWWSGSRYRP